MAKVRGFELVGDRPNQEVSVRVWVPDTQAALHLIAALQSPEFDALCRLTSAVVNARVDHLNPPPDARAMTEEQYATRLRELGITDPDPARRTTPFAGPATDKDRPRFTEVLDLLADKLVAAETPAKAVIDQPGQLVSIPDSTQTVPADSPAIQSASNAPASATVEPALVNETTLSQRIQERLAHARATRAEPKLVDVAVRAEELVEAPESAQAGSPSNPPAEIMEAKTFRDVVQYFIDHSITAAETITATCAGWTAAPAIAKAGDALPARVVKALTVMLREREAPTT